MIITTKELFQHAYGRYAVGAYNINNLEQTVGLFRGALGLERSRGFLHCRLAPEEVTVTKSQLAELLRAIKARLNSRYANIGAPWKLVVSVVSRGVGTIVIRVKRTVLDKGNMTSSRRFARWASSLVASAWSVDNSIAFDSRPGSAGQFEVEMLSTSRLPLIRFHTLRGVEFSWTRMAFGSLGIYWPHTPRGSHVTTKTQQASCGT